ncbi:unnamed protein product [Brassicogethes aeneus]|uniref:Multidrug resistance-associated protein 4-like n=1 Tax=Brassicogethes aeneus TaxID=1431903 RepID=A0A9P0B8M0_BRAAE|nr:unnamed protein product [Brassicogethes aeneus]
MDSSKKYKNPSPEENANIFSKLFFCWLLPFFKYGYKNDLQLKDIYNTANKDATGPLADELEKHWIAEIQKAKKSNSTPNLSTAIKNTFWKSYAVFGFSLFLQWVVIKMMQPLVIAWYINYFQDDPNKDTTLGWILATAVTSMAFVNILISHHTNLGCQRIGLRVRVACGSLVYRKILRLNQKSLAKTAAGHLVNLLSNDLQRFDQASTRMHFIWIMPILACIASVIMYSQVGFACLAGLISMAIQAVPIQGYLSKLQGQLRYKVAKKTDFRVKLMNEITLGIQVIKMYAWEIPFQKMVEASRKYEISIITKTSYILGFTRAMTVYTERTALYLTLITYVLMGNRLTGEVVFSMAQLFNTVQFYMCINYPMAVSSLAEAKVSVKRLEEFLTLDETMEELKDKEIPAQPGLIKLTKINASWIPNPIVDTLRNIDLNIPPGTLCCVTGNVGTGKSSLLQLLLKELPYSSGKLDVQGDITYASQEPWLFVSNVRNNILFGQPYVKNRYKQVVKACALERDFELFPFGDKTLVGERGVSLSGGQRARINLARAVYRKSDIYLFDDPLSAVDTHVGKHLFEECIKKYLNNKTRILVTHQLQFLKDADLIVVLNNGQVEKVGTYSQLSLSELKHIVAEQNQEQNNENIKEETMEIVKRDRSMSVTSYASTIEEEREPEETEELMAKGALSSQVYTEYCKAGGNVFVIMFFVFLFAIAQASNNAGDIWLRFWTNNEEGIDSSNDTTSSINSTQLNVTNLISNMTSSTDIPKLWNENEDYIQKRNIYIYVYTFFIIAAIILTNARSMLFFKICMNASRNLHNKMFMNILQAPMRFFDTNPSGRILTRFSKDMGVVDELLPRATLDALQVFFVMFGIICMVFIVTPWMMLPTIFLGILFYYARTVYLATAQDVMRLEGLSRAPMYSHVSATLYGMSTIRSSKAQRMIVKEFDTLQDQNTGTWFLYLANSETFGFYLDMISTMFLAIVTYQFLIFDDGSTLKGDVGLVITQSLILMGMLQFGVRQTAEVAGNMTSVERILQYTKLDKEGPFESLPTKKPPQGWPSAGEIKFKNTYLKYVPEDPPVLKNLNIEIKPGEKVGIVGRTGAGKSTLIASLFRLAKIEGLIEIDNIDTESIGLEDLRKNISIIPQEPVLFSATVRYNLDPFDKCSDQVLWKALEDVELKDSVEALTQEVSEGGSNFSAGQRQLVCLARAIVRNNKILVMDEATANVDPHTDALIQQTIRKNFKNCTVITIAHRLNTIMDSDKVLVMDAGQCVEFDHPHVLLQNPEGYFTKMLEQTGKNLEEKLRKVAQDAHEQNLNKAKEDATDEVLDRNEPKEENKEQENEGNAETKL